MIGPRSASTAAFVYLIDYAARLLRPVSIVWRLGEEGLRVIEQVYPARIKGKHVPTMPHPPFGRPERILFHVGTSAIFVAVDIDTLHREACRTHRVIEFAHQMGDFIAVGEPLMR
jgi:uncharacterized membrane protein